MPDEPRQRYEITKYPNRRFYDATERRHVTLSDLHQLVRSGHEIVVTDKNTGRDITNIVLTQIILEHDPPKMDLFPASLLHQAIQMNESMARRFIDQYLGQAMDAFTQSRRQFEAFLRQSGIPTIPQVAPPVDWLRSLIPGMNVTSPKPASAPDADDAEPSTHSDAPPPPDSRDEQIEALQRQIAELGDQFAKLREPEKPKPPRNVKKKRAVKKKAKSRKR